MFCLRSHTVASLSSVKNLISIKNVNKVSPVSFRMVTSSSNTETSPKWELLSAVCLERTPIIIPPMTKIEMEMSQRIEELDTKKSLKSDHELRQEEDRKLMKNIGDGNQEDNNPEAATRQTAQDFEDLSNEELAKFKPAPRITDEDLKGDRKSTNRKLDRHLLFVVQEKVGDKKFWRLPQSSWKNGETLRQTAERALKDHVKTPDTSVRILGNAPWGVHTVKYPASIRGKMGYNGAKIFFFKAQLLSRNCITCSDAEYNWLGREELEQRLEPEYLRCVEKFLIDED